MTKNSYGGKGHKRAKRPGASAGPDNSTIFRENDTQDYGLVLTALGNGRFSVYCNDNQERLGTLCGTMRRRVWIAACDVVLFSKRGFQDDKIDIIHKYSPDDIKLLARLGELSTKLLSNQSSRGMGGIVAECDNGEENYIVFDDGEGRLDRGDIDIPAI